MSKNRHELSFFDLLRPIKIQGSKQDVVHEKMLRSLCLMYKEYFL